LWNEDNQNNGIHSSINNHQSAIKKAVDRSLAGVDRQPIQKEQPGFLKAWGCPFY
jgi:hypothetical protein